jgi:hypothetical protein
MGRDLLLLPDGIALHWAAKLGISGGWIMPSWVAPTITLLLGRGVRVVKLDR